MNKGDIVRLTANARLTTPAGYRVPYDAGNQFRVRSHEGDTLTVKSPEGYTVSGPANLFEFVREVANLGQ